jgi:nitrilase
MAAEKGARLVALPEYFPILGMHELDKVAVREQPGRGPIQAFLSSTAKKHGIWLVGGSAPLACASPGKVRNTCLVYDDRGRLKARYDKIHLFGFTMGKESYAEERIERARIVTVNTPFARLGISTTTCASGAVSRDEGRGYHPVPSAFTATTGKVHWETLIRARAIENLA